MWQELPQITVRLEEGHTTYRFTGSFDGKHTLPEKAVKLVDEQKGVHRTIHPQSKEIPYAN